MLAKNLRSITAQVRGGRKSTPSRSRRDLSSSLDLYELERKAVVIIDWAVKGTLGYTAWEIGKTLEYKAELEKHTFRPFRFFQREPFAFTKSAARDMRDLFRWLFSE